MRLICVRVCTSPPMWLAHLKMAPGRVYGTHGLCWRAPGTRGQSIANMQVLVRARARGGVCGRSRGPRTRAPSVMTTHHVSGDARGQATRIRAHIAPRAIIAQTPVVSASRSMPPTHLSATCTAANTCSERPAARGWSLRAMLCDKKRGHGARAC